MHRFEHATSNSVSQAVLDDFRAVQEYQRRTGARGRFEVRHDAQGRRIVVPSSPASAGADLAARRRRLDAIARQDLADRTRRLDRLEREIGGDR